MFSATQDFLESANKFELMLIESQNLTFVWDLYYAFLCLSEKLALSPAFK